jgi:RNA polymerase sigma-70 factor, ECF subfamily
MTAEADDDVASSAAAFDRLYLAARDRLAIQIAALTGDRSEASDHVQEAFMRAWLRWPTVSGLDDPEAWVRRVAYNLAVSRWRRARRAVLRPQPDTHLELDHAQLELIEGLRGLARAEREAIVLHDLVGLSVREVADELGAKEGTVKSWLSRGRTRLAARLEVTA